MSDGGGRRIDEIYIYVYIYTRSPRVTIANSTSNSVSTPPNPPQTPPPPPPLTPSKRTRVRERERFQPSSGFLPLTLSYYPTARALPTSGVCQARARTSTHSLLEPRLESVALRRYELAHTNGTRSARRSSSCFSTPVALNWLYSPADKCRWACTRIGH